MRDMKIVFVGDQLICVRFVGVKDLLCGFYIVVDCFEYCLFFKLVMWYIKVFFLQYLYLFFYKVEFVN